jgi:hypothetical protein
MRAGKRTTLLALWRLNRGSPSKRQGPNLSRSTDFNLRNELKLAVHDVEDANGRVFASDSEGGRGGRGGEGEDGRESRESRLRKDEMRRRKKEEKKETHLHHPDGLSTSRSSPFPLDEFTSDSSDTEQPNTLTTQTTNFLFSSLEVAVVQIEVGLREGGLVGEDEVRDEGGGLAGVASLRERERGRESL